MAPFAPFPFLSLILFLISHVHAEMSASVKQPLATALMANDSGRLNPNTSSISAFSYIIPFHQTQDCNIYGPLCQTGSIIVGVNLTSATATTVLPCSSYLSAQSTYIANENYPGDPDGYFFPYDLSDGSDLSNWDINFGQSPECRSFAEAISQEQYTFSGCGSSSLVAETGQYADSLRQIPPGVLRYAGHDSLYTCCGDCSLDIPEVRLYYFPDKMSIDCHNNKTSNSTSSLLAQTLRKRVHSLVADGSTAVVSGLTFTSPSLYLQLLGTAGVSDRCTTVGTKLINPVITLPPNGLSTWKPPVNPLAYDYDNFTVGEIWSDPTHFFQEPIEAGIKQLDLKDLACPTWGLGKSTAANGAVITTIGPPWLPLIVPPINLFTLDPKWSAECTGLFSDQFELTTFALFDPPIALTPAAVLASTLLVLPTRTPVPTPADPTTIPDPAQSSSKGAKPASIPNDPVAAPAKTENPEKAIPSPSPVSDPDPLPDSSAAYTNNEGDPPSEPLSSSKEPSLSVIAGDSPAGSITPSSSALDPPSGDSQQLASDPTMPIPMPVQGGNTQAQTQGLGAIIYNAFGKSGPDDNGVKGAVNTVPIPPQSIFTIGAQTFTANPTGFNVDNTVISPGDAAHTVDGTSISLDKSGVLAIGSSTVSLTNPLTTVLAVAGQTFTPNPTAFSIAGSIVSAGGLAITIDGTTVSLDQSGALAIGRTTISLTDPSPTPFTPEVFTIADQTFTANPSAFPIAGTTISADGPAITVSGTVISLGQSGALRIGSSTIPLASPPDPSLKVYTIAGQTFTPNPSAFPIANTIVSAGGAAPTIDGTIISLGQSGALVIGSSTVNLPAQFHTPYNKAYTIAGQTFTPNPSAFSIAGTAISAGGPAVTIDGTIITLQPSGTLLLGSSTIVPPLESHSIFSSDNDITIDGLQIEAQQASFVVAGDGVTLSAGAPGVTISETVVSLESGGETLDIDRTGRFALPTPTPTPLIKGFNGSEANNVQAFTGGQGRGFSASSSPLLLLLLCGIWGVVMFAGVGLM